MRLIDVENSKVLKKYHIPEMAFTTWMSPDGAYAAFQVLQVDLWIMEIETGEL